MITRETIVLLAQFGNTLGFVLSSNIINPTEAKSIITKVIVIFKYTANIYVSFIEK